MCKSEEDEENYLLFYKELLEPQVNDSEQDHCKDLAAKILLCGHNQVS